ncbi:MAG: hypothetical protein ABSA40_05725 [Candidatus Dormibacteria bacterium]|jgi:hypothetical protein
MPDVPETELRDDPLAGELRAYFQTTASTLRPRRWQAQMAPPPPPTRRRMTLQVVLAAALAAVLAAGLSATLILSHQPAAPSPSPLAEPLLVFSAPEEVAGTSTCRQEFDTMAVSGGALQQTASTGGACGGEAVVAGRVIVAPTENGVAVIDAVTGARHAIDLPGMPAWDAQPVVAPDETEIAVPIDQTSESAYPASIDEVSLSTAAVTRHLTLSGAVVSQLKRAGSAAVEEGWGLSVTAWLSDGIHALGVCAKPGTAECGYLINPDTGSVTGLSTEDGAETVTGSPNGQIVAVVEPAGTIAVGPVGGALPAAVRPQVAYAIPPEVLAVGDDGSVLVAAESVRCLSGPPLCVVATIGPDVYFVMAHGTTTTVTGPAGGGGPTLQATALPGGGFILVTSGASVASQVVWLVSAAGVATTVATISAPAAGAAAPTLIGLAT